MPAEAELERIVSLEGLEKYFERLIAKKESVRPEDVTEEYIRNERSRKIYPVVRYDIDSNYGGYCSTGLMVLTRDEIKNATSQMEQARKEYDL